MQGALVTPERFGKVFGTVVCLKLSLKIRKNIYYYVKLDIYIVLRRLCCYTFLSNNNSFTNSTYYNTLMNILAVRLHMTIYKLQ